MRFKTVSKVALLEISEAPLNASIFDLPAGYRQALQTGNGGADLTKPDTITDRAQDYWTRLTSPADLSNCVTATGLPPASGTENTGLPAPGTNKIVPFELQLAPRN